MFRDRISTDWVSYIKWDYIRRIPVDSVTGECNLMIFFSIFHITLSFRSEILATSEGKALARFVRSDIYVDVELRGAMEA